MKPLDRLLQRWRISKAGRHLPPRARVLDVGCFDGTLFRQLRASTEGGLGLDPALERELTVEGARLLPGHFPDDLPSDAGPFDGITMLAVVEHVPAEVQRVWAEASEAHLRPGGRLVITTPSPLVDRILDGLRVLRLVDGIALEEHYGFDPSLVPSLFERPGLKLVARRRFQLGLNNLFVFERLPS